MMSAPKGHVRAQPARLFGETDRIITQMPALHPLEDQVIAMLQGKVQMRHQARFGGNGLHQVVIDLDRVDGTDPQTRKIRHQLENPHHQITEPRCRRQVSPPRTSGPTPVSTTSL